MSLATDALAHAKLGLEVLPLYADKTPRTPHGYKDATTDPAKIKAWPKGTTHYGILGRAFIDIDGPDGEETLTRLEAELGKLPVTAEQKTPKGRHLAFDGALPTTVAKLGPGLDTRGPNGYIATGKGYTWTRPASKGLAELPAAWLDRLTGQRNTGSSATAARSKLAELLADPPGEGARNNWLTALCGHLAKAHKHRDAYDAFVFDYGREVGLDDAEIKKTADSIWSTEHAKDDDEHPTISVVSAADFASVDEPGAEPLIGEGDDVVVAQGSECMFYGDGGSGKTTLSIDLACHLAAGEDWLGFEVPRAVCVLMIEREGPRPLLRRKIARKLKFWTGGAIDNRFLLLDEPWAKFTFASEPWRDAIAWVIRDKAIDLLIVGPLTRVGMDEAGTLQQVRDFEGLVEDLRARSGRPLAVLLIHHENRAGTVSGAWEGAGDTLVHVEERSHGSTAVTFQKTRWASNVHGTTMELAWTAGEGYRVKDERDLLGQLKTYLVTNPWKTANEIAEPAAKGGIGANKKTVAKELKEHQGTFASEPGDQHGRSANATLWALRQGQGQPPNPDDPDNVQTGAQKGVRVTGSPRRGTQCPDPDPLSGSAPSTQTGLEDLI